MKLGMIQSNYLPWVGYMDFIDDSDLFIFYDDVQYTRKDWRNRNKIKTQNGPLWLTVPVLFSRNDTDTRIESVKIDYSKDWVRKHTKTISLSYSKAPFYEPYAEQFFNILNERHERLSELNIALIKWMMSVLDIKTEIKMSRDIASEGSRTDRILDIIDKVGADSYLVGPAAKDYIEVDKFKKAGIGLEWKGYEYSEYPQLYPPFEKGLSTLDIIFNCGPQSFKFIKSIKPNDRVV